jgi:DNA-binding XRE family transcriptional regulator
LLIVYKIEHDKSRVRNWRTKWGLSEVKLAKALGVWSMTVARWEWGTIGILALLPLALEAGPGGGAIR